MVIRPHGTVLVPTGITTAFSPKYRISIRERGSNANLAIVLAGQIDSGFSGMFVALYNTSDVSIYIIRVQIHSKKVSLC